MAKADKTEVAKVDETSKLPSVDTLPDWMKEDAGKGVESMRAEDFALPRILLLQPLHPQIEAFAGEAKVGEFWHSIANKSLGPTFRMVPILATYQYILWNPRESGGGILAKASDGVHWDNAHAEFEIPVPKGGGRTVRWKTAETVVKSGLDRFGSADPSDPRSYPAAMLYYNILVALPDFPELSPSVLSLSKTQITVGKQLFTQIQGMRAPSFGINFKVSSVTQTKGENKFKQFVFTPAGYVNDKAQYAQYKEMYEHFQKLGIQIKDEDQMQNEPGEETSSTASPGAENAETGKY